MGEQMHEQEVMNFYFGPCLRPRLHIGPVRESLVARSAAGQL